MELDVYWTRIAVNKLFAIMEHYRSIEGTMVASALFDGLLDETLALENDPYLGEPEPALSDRPQNFRYLLHKNFRILYWINEEKGRIDVATIFETGKSLE